MDVSDPNDVMEMDAGLLLQTGEYLDVDLASMRDPSIEPDADFMIEDIQEIPASHDALDTNMIAEVATDLEQEENDDEMLDEDAHADAPVDFQENLQYDNHFHDDFDDTFQATADSHFEDSNEYVHDGHPEAELPPFDFESTNTQTQAIGDSLLAPTADAASLARSHQDEARELHEGTAENDGLGPGLTEAQAIQPGGPSLATPPPDSQVDNAETAIKEGLEGEPRIFAIDTGAENLSKNRPEQAISEGVKDIREHTEQAGLLEEQGQEGMADELVGSLEEVKEAQNTEQHDELPNEAADQAYSGRGTELHPVKVFHDGSEVYLFRPTGAKSSDTFFLHDDNLGHQSLKILLKSCREVLEGSISEDDELEIDFHDLGLRTSEDSSHASQITLSQVLDVYLRLKQNEGESSPPPLYVSLQSIPHFSGRFFAVAKAAEEGKGLANLAWWQDSFNIESEEQILQNHPEDNKFQGHSNQINDEDYQEYGEDRNESGELKQGDLFEGNEEGNEHGNISSSNAYDDTTHQSIQTEQDPGTSGLPLSANAENSKASTSGDIKNGSEESGAGDVESIETSTLEGDDAEHANDFSTSNEHDDHPEGDFFDAAVQAYDDHHNENYDFGAEDYGSHTGQPPDADDEEFNQISGPHDEARADKTGDPSEEFEDSSFAFINEDEFTNTDEVENLSTQQHPKHNGPQEAISDIAQNRSNLQALHRGAFTTESLASDQQSVGGPAKTNGSTEHSPPEQEFDDSDEINYDDDDEPPLADPPGNFTPKSRPLQDLESPKTSKRGRGDDDEDRIEYTTPDPKRRRS